ncbi:porin family protein [Pseudopedobacter sp.]|uniref:porin family protein n=1 Tax=Pseudopedobacter sp. TaxID=1936787 RepID=UPI00333FC189
MKKLFLVAAAFIIGSAAYAQTSSVGTTKFGLKAGVNLPKYKYELDDTSTDSEVNTNFHITGYADIPLTGGLSLQPGISLQGKGGKNSWTVLGVETVSKVNTMSIDIPVNIVGYIPAGPGSFFIGAGPYVGFNVSGKAKTTIGGGTESEEDLNFGNNSDDDLKPIDFGLNGLVGYQFSSGFNIGAGYGLGLSNLYPGSEADDNSKINNRVLSFSIGFAF